MLPLVGQGFDQKSVDGYSLSPDTGLRPYYGARRKMGVTWIPQILETKAIGKWLDAVQFASVHDEVLGRRFAGIAPYWHDLQTLQLSGISRNIDRRESRGRKYKSPLY
jgi:hypothetical protein